MCASTKLLFCFVTRHHVFAPRSFCTYRCCTRFPWVNTIAFAIQPPQPDALAWNRHTVQNASLPYFLFARASSAQHGLNLFGILRRLPASKGSFVFVGANIKLRIVHILHHAAKTDQCSLAHSIDANIVDLRDRFEHSGYGERFLKNGGDPPVAVAVWFRSSGCSVKKRSDGAQGVDDTRWVVLRHSCGVRSPPWLLVWWTAVDSELFPIVEGGL
mmetsp:Transcript_7880/g.28786  ORF Transcript_7880/g.28786 Transcript_7880/m.28786 type:complete len:215 (+) Transcript_7880:1601-2245(+)